LTTWLLLVELVVAVGIMAAVVEQVGLELQH
jgi:hypothetical protein